MKENSRVIRNFPLCASKCGYQREVIGRCFVPASYHNPSTMLTLYADVNIEVITAQLNAFSWRKNKEVFVLHYGVLFISEAPIWDSIEHENDISALKWPFVECHYINQLFNFGLCPDASNMREKLSIAE